MTETTPPTIERQIAVIKLCATRLSLAAQKHGVGALMPAEEDITEAYLLLVGAAERVDREIADEDQAHARNAAYDRTAS